MVGSGFAWARVAAMRWAGAGVVLAGIGFAGGCVIGPSAERVRCLETCARFKDACMVEATSAKSVQRCDRQGLGCSGECPP